MRCKLCGKNLIEDGKAIAPYFKLVVPIRTKWNYDKAGAYCLGCFCENEVRTNL